MNFALIVAFVLVFFVFVFWVLSVHNIIRVTHFIALVVILLVMQQLTYLLMG